MHFRHDTAFELVCLSLRFNYTLSYLTLAFPWLALAKHHCSCLFFVTSRCYFYRMLTSTLRRRHPVICAHGARELCGFAAFETYLSKTWTEAKLHLRKPRVHVTQGTRWCSLDDFLIASPYSAQRLIKVRGKSETYFDTMLFHQLWQSGLFFVHSILLPPSLQSNTRNKVYSSGYTLLRLKVTFSATRVRVVLTFCPSHSQPHLSGRRWSLACTVHLEL